MTSNPLTDELRAECEQLAQIFRKTDDGYGPDTKSDAEQLGHATRRVFLLLLAAYDSRTEQLKTATEALEKLAEIVHAALKAIGEVK